jgi:hypothetical protein
MNPVSLTASLTRSPDLLPFATVHLTPQEILFLNQPEASNFH